MPRDYLLYLADIRVSCEKIIRYTKGLSKEQFFRDELTYDAVLRNLLVIGEAAKNLPEIITRQFSLVDLKKICGFRDIAHAYFGIDNAILWDIVDTKISALLDALQVP